MTIFGAKKDRFGNYDKATLVIIPLLERSTTGRELWSGKLPEIPGMLMVKNRGKNRGKTGENRAETGPRR